MASPKTIELQRDRVLMRLQSFRVVSEESEGGNRAYRRRQLKAVAKEYGLTLKQAMDMIREEKRKE